MKGSRTAFFAYQAQSNRTDELVVLIASGVIRAKVQLRCLSNQAAAAAVGVAESALSRGRLAVDALHSWRWNDFLPITSSLSLIWSITRNESSTR